MSEQWYDAEIAPALMKLAKRCEDRGVAFVAAVEYAPGERGTTAVMPQDAGLEMVMIRHCVHTAPNIDGYVLGLARYARDHGIDTGASLVMAAMTPNARVQRAERSEGPLQHAVMHSPKRSQE